VRPLREQLLINEPCKHDRRAGAVDHPKEQAILAQARAIGAYEAERTAGLKASAPNCSACWPSFVRRPLGRPDAGGSGFRNHSATMWLDDNDGASFAWCLRNDDEQTKSLSLLAGAAFALGVAVAAGTSALPSLPPFSLPPSSRLRVIRCAVTRSMRCIACHDLNTGVTRLGPRSRA
jgi:hypothetical protein